jgi:hypothetical protein
LDRMVAREEFPPPVTLSPGRVGWRLSTIKEWIASRPAAPRRPQRGTRPKGRRPAEMRGPTRRPTQ